MGLSDYDYDLPPERIANAPARPRDSSRLMVVNRTRKDVAHHRFYEFPTLLRPDDLLVLNDTRVRPARLYGRKFNGMGRVEVLLVNATPDGAWDALVRPGRRLKNAAIVLFTDNVSAVVEGWHDGLCRLRFNLPPDELARFLEEAGSAPIPPYIHAESPNTLREDYQTIYAAQDGAIAAPTAGLHFTSSTFEALKSRGIQHVFVTLHVGIGTFQPVREEYVEQHRMHAEAFSLSPGTANAINDAKRAGRRIVAIGTTTARVLESSAKDGLVIPRAGETELFITKREQFQIIDALITNFHLPRSTLLMLVCAFAGRDLILQAYREAIEMQYRFYSFGDAMFIE